MKLKSRKINRTAIADVTKEQFKAAFPSASYDGRTKTFFLSDEDATKFNESPYVTQRLRFSVQIGG